MQFDECKNIFVSFKSIIAIGLTLFLTIVSYGYYTGVKTENMSVRLTKTEEQSVKIEKKLEKIIVKLDSLIICIND